MADEKNSGIMGAWIGVFGVIVAALITIIPQIRQSNANASEQSKSSVPPEAPNKKTEIKEISNDSPTTKPPPARVKIQLEDKIVYEFDKDLCNTIYSIIGDARSGFKNLLFSIDTIKTKPWLETKINTKVKSSIFTSGISKSIGGNSLFMEYKGQKPGDAESLYKKYEDKIKECLEREGTLDTNKYGSKFYRYNINNYCQLEIKYMVQHNECDIIFRSLIVGEKAW